MDNKEKYMSLLEFFDPKKFDHGEVADILEKVMLAVKEKGGEHQAACAWIVMVLYKRGKCTTLQVEELIDEFNGWMEGLDGYLESFENPQDRLDLIFTYYNGFLQKKIKGD